MHTDDVRQLAAYNHWANRRLYATALAMPDESYRRPTGVFFGSLHGTLNHLLLTDRIWLKRLTGEGEHPDKRPLAFPIRKRSKSWGWIEDFFRRQISFNLQHLSCDQACGRPS